MFGISLAPRLESRLVEASHPSHSPSEKFTQVKMYLRTLTKSHKIFVYSALQPEHVSSQEPIIQEFEYYLESIHVN